MSKAPFVLGGIKHQNYCEKITKGSKYCILGPNGYSPVSSTEDMTPNKEIEKESVVTIESLDALKTTQKQILFLLTKNKTLNISDLTKELNLSRQTVANYCKDLNDKGLVKIDAYNTSKIDLKISKDLVIETFEDELQELTVDYPEYSKTSNTLIRKLKNLPNKTITTTTRKLKDFLETRSTGSILKCLKKLEEENVIEVLRDNKKGTTIKLKK